MVIGVYEAKTQLSKLFGRVANGKEVVANGKEVVLGKAGKSLARLVPYRKTKQPRVPGRLAGKVRIAADFDETPDWSKA